MDAGWIWPQGPQKVPKVEAWMGLFWDGPFSLVPETREGY